MRENEGVLLDFYDKLANLIKSKQQNIETYITLFGEIKIALIKDNYSRRKDILNKVFNDKELYYLFHIYFLWLLCDAKYFPEKGEECKIPIDIIYKYINEFYEKYKKDKDHFIKLKVPAQRCIKL